MSWRDERRADRAAEAEAQRQAEIAKAEAEAIRTRALAEAEQTARADRAAEQARHRQERLQAREQRRTRRGEALTALRTWAVRHVTELLIYPLAVVSAVLAMPAMADYGTRIYGQGTGMALFVLSELGMWAFSIAVQVARHRDPDRPVASLQAGVWLFAAAGATWNALHGAERGLDAAVVMGLASIAGVVAHQLVVARPRRTPEQRDAMRLARAERRRVRRVRRAAVRHAVAELDATGQARLVYRAGTVTLTRQRGRLTLTPAVVPGRAVTPADEWDDALAALVTTEQYRTVSGVTGPGQPGDSDTTGTDTAGGGIATAEEPTRPGGNTAYAAGRAAGELDELVARARQAITTGQLAPRPSQRAIRQLLGIRTARAREVQHRLRENTQP